MGLGFVLLIWAIFAVVLGLVWATSLGIFLFGKAKGSRILSWLGGVPLAASSFVGVIFILFIACAVIYNGFLIIRNILRR